MACKGSTVVMPSVWKIVTSSRHTEGVLMVGDMVGATGDNVGATGDNVGATGDNVGATGDNVGATVSVNLLGQKIAASVGVSS